MEQYEVNKELLKQNLNHLKDGYSLHDYGEVIKYLLNKHQIIDNELLQEVSRWNKKGYEFSFQFWGEGNNNCFVMKDGVYMFDSGGYESPNEAVITSLNYVYRVNRTPHNKRIMNKNKP